MPKYIDITGKKFGKLFVLRRSTDVLIRKRASYECLCDCGSIRFYETDLIRRGVTTSCGLCIVNENIGKKFNNLTILKFTEKRNRLTYVLCKCDCGNELEVATTFVTRGLKKSCGCHIQKNILKKAELKIGSKFEKLKILSIYGKNKRNNTLFLCKCKCGNKTIVRNGCWGWVSSCGCLQKENILKGDQSSNSKFTKEEALALRELFNSNSGYSCEDLSKMFNVSVYTIRRIVYRRSYKNI